MKKYRFFQDYAYDKEKKIEFTKYSSNFCGHKLHKVLVRDNLWFQPQYSYLRTQQLIFLAAMLY